MRSELEKLTVKVLIKDYATPLNIVGRHDMKKADLIQAIIDASSVAETEAKSEVEENESKVSSTHEQLENFEKTQKQLEDKMKYVENAEVGTIVAFKIPGMKTKSAKIVRKSTKNKKFKVETSYGAEFVVSYDDILWVKTNKRWPKGVYNLLKGIEV